MEGKITKVRVHHLLDEDVKEVVEDRHIKIVEPFVL